ncbi:MAG: flagellar brake protein [Parasulfuritortus sp.]|jgi:c-di-GMP-binding flagellar brake protein YcgR|nr:flagellar brake protein [Parasulfuritortus sp.]
MKIDICNPDEIERFKIDHPGEIERILSSVMAKKALVTAYSENNRDFLVTSLAAVDMPGKAIYFGAGNDAALNQALVASHEVSFNTAHDQVRVLFTTPGLTLTTLAGEQMLKAPMPAELLRFQRREYYRLPTPMAKPVKCLIEVKDSVLETTVRDISIGGIGVLAYTEDLGLHEGDTYHGCRLSLPDAGSYLVSLHIRMIYEPVEKNGIVTRRLGCQFIDLAPSVETDIQRYIIRVERERRASAF